MNTISSITGMGNYPISNIASSLGQNMITKPYIISQGQTSNPISNLTSNPQTNFLQNFVYGMMNLANTFMQNMFSIVGIQATNSGANIEQVTNTSTSSSSGILSNLTNIIGNLFSNKGGSSILNTIGNLIGGMFGSSNTSSANGAKESSGGFWSNLWNGAKGLLGGIFGDSNSTSSSNSSSGSIFSNIWSGIKGIFGSGSSGSGFSFSNILSSVCSLFS